MGKDNIRLENGSLLKVEFRKGSHQLTLGLKAELFSELMKVASKGESKQIALKMVETPIQELFEIKE